MKLKERLLNKSKQTFILSLEIYNRLTTEYRVEAFCILFINSWELLLKAKILQDMSKVSSIFYKKEKNKPRKSISLSGCLKKVFTENDPIRKNIEEIQDLRDSSIHLIVDELDMIYIGLFQAGVLNYTDCLNKWFSINLNEKINPSMLSIMFDKDSLDFLKIKKKYGKEIMDFLKSKQKKIMEKTNEIKDRRYNIEVEYKLALVKNPKKADIVLSKGDDARVSGILIEVPKDVNKTHPFRSVEIIREVNKKIKGRKITSYDFQAIVYKEKIRKRQEFHYFFPQLNSRLYSHKFVDFIINKINSNKDYLVNVRGLYGKYMSKKIRENKLRKIKSNNRQERLFF